VAHAFPTFAGEVPLTEYGTHEGVPNRLYFVPHAKVGAGLVRHHRRSGFAASL
jgi:hypothetical protein